MQKITLFGAIFLIVLIPVLSPRAEISPWPMFRHDRQHTGRSPYSGPDKPTYQWSYQTGDGVASSPSIGPDGTIYVGTGWYWFQTTDSALYALNPDGSLKWKFSAGSGIFSSPAIDKNGTIYFGSFDRFLYAVEDSSTFGHLKWKTDLGLIIFGSPVLGDDGTTYIGALNFRFMAIDSTGYLKWLDPTNWCIFSSAAIDSNGIIYCGSKDHRLYAFRDLDSTDERVWQHAFGVFYSSRLVDASPAIGGDGTIYVGTDQYGASGITPEPADTSFWAVNPDGSLKWGFYVGDGVESSPAIGPDGTLYFGSYDSCLFAVKDMGTYGKLLWKYKTNGAIDASPTVGGDGTIYIGSRDSTMYAFNPDGTILWTYKTEGGIESSVTIAGDGRIYFGSMDGKVYSLGDIGSDVGPYSVDVPDTIIGETMIMPTVEVHNYRTSVQSFDVALTINKSDSIYYADSAHITDLPGGGDTIISLEPWSAIPDGYDRTFSVSAITVLSGDNNQSNDTLNKEIVLGPEYLCGDANGDRIINIFDITHIIAYLYLSGPPPVNLQTCDVNSDGVVNIFDITYLVAYLYLAGSPPNCL
jgi:outer membrane protein assembly factor BamB